MISKQTLKDYQFNSITDYFDYLVESKINGNNKEVTNLINDMSAAQKKDCIDYLALLDEDETIQILMYEVKELI